MILPPTTAPRPGLRVAISPVWPRPRSRRLLARKIIAPPADGFHAGAASGCVRRAELADRWTGLAVSAWWLRRGHFLKDRRRWISTCYAAGWRRSPGRRGRRDIGAVDHEHGHLINELRPHGHRNPAHCRGAVPGVQNVSRAVSILMPSPAPCPFSHAPGSGGDLSHTKTSTGCGSQA
jgi:hypothetical protein